MEDRRTRRTEEGGLRTEDGGRTGWLAGSRTEDGGWRTGGLGGRRTGWPAGWPEDRGRRTRRTED